MKKADIDRDEVSRMLSVEAVARQYNVSLPAKSNGVIRCPLYGHDDSTPSFSIDLDSGLWNCFGCDKKGDIFSLVAELENLDVVSDFVQVLEKSADIAGVARNIPSQKKKSTEKGYKEVWDEAKGGDLSAARTAYISKKKIDLEKIEIDVRPHEKDDFIIPIRSAKGRMLGLQRGIKMAIAGSNVGGFFYENLDRKETLYIVEGLSDYLSMLSCGYKNVIGLFSVNVPEKEIKDIISDAHDVKICLDYDHFDENGAARGSDAGFNKTKKILKVAQHAMAYFASYTEKLDISDLFVRKGEQGVHEIFEQPGKNYNDLEHDMEAKLIPSFDPRIIAEDMAQNDLIATGEKESWIFEDGLWKEVAKEYIEKLISLELVNRGAAKSVFKNITEIRNFLRLETYSRIAKIKEAVLQEDLNENIYFANGKYDIKNDEFSPYTPHDYVFSRLDSDFEVCSKEPDKFLKFLGQVFEGYEEPEKYIAFIQEWMGYCLFPKTPIHAFLYIYGSGGNGKGVLFNVIADIVGHNNILNYNINKLESDGDRAVVQLFKKYVNLGTEEKRGTNLGSPILKSLTGGDPVTGRMLWKEAFTFRPYAKMLFSSNHAPSWAELASNISRRLNLIHLTNIFDDGDARRGNINLENEILTQKAEITWWAVQGLKRLLERGWFDKPDSMMKNEKKMLIMADPVASFVENGLPPSMKGDTPVQLRVVYEEFKEYSQDVLGKSIRYTLSRQSFVENMEKQGFICSDITGVKHIGRDPELGKK